jgi:hypothetical protein
MFICRDYIYYCITELMVIGPIVGVALLRPERRPGVVPVSERHHLQPGAADVRLVVQRALQLVAASLRAERAPLQVHHAAPSHLPGGLLGAAGGRVPGGEAGGAARQGAGPLRPHQKQTQAQRVRGRRRAADAARQNAWTEQMKSSAVLMLPLTHVPLSPFCRLVAVIVGGQNEILYCISSLFRNCNYFL